ncbi:MAG: PilZ domain-containing protein [Pyrinomonadaceae bacterium]
MLLRKLASIVTQTIAERRAAPRKKVQLPVRITFEPRASGPKQEAARTDLSIDGVTRDVSVCGIGAVVSSIRVKENYLVGQDRVLRLELAILPARTITMKVVGRRYEEIGFHTSTERFLVGLEIVEMSDDDRAAYEHFVANVERLAKGAGGLKLETQ